MAKRDEGQVIEAGGGDILLVNPAGDRDQDSPGGILIPAKTAKKLGPNGLGDNPWQTALRLVKERQATAFPVKALQSLSGGVTAITLLLDKPPGGPKTPQKSAGKKAAPKARAKSKKR